jgi:hypothetical protein
LFLQANWHIKIERENQEGLITMASVERISKIKRRTSIKPLGAKSSSAVEGASKIIEIERIIMHDGFVYYPTI